MVTVTPFLWFDHRLEEAVTFYVGLFEGSRVLHASRYGRGIALDLQARSPQTIDAELGPVPALETVATLDPESESITIFAVNRGAEVIALDSNGMDLTGYRVGEHITLTHPDLKAANTVEQPNTVTPRNNGDAVIREGGLLANLAGLSWNVIRLARTM